MRKVLSNSSQQIAYLDQIYIETTIIFGILIKI